MISTDSRPFSSVESDELAPHAKLSLACSPLKRLGFLIGAQREFCRAWPNQSAVTVKGAHFLPEDCRKRWVQPRQVLSPRC
jgi:hypothetical protein